MHDDVFSKEVLHLKYYTAMISCLFNFVNWHNYYEDKSENSRNDACYNNIIIGKIYFNTDAWIRVYIWDAASFYNEQVSKCYYYNISGLGLPLLCQPVQYHVASYIIVSMIHLWRQRWSV